MVGWGYETGTVTAGWVFKLIGADATLKCTNYLTPSGYNTLIPILNSDISTAKTCASYTMWTYITP